MAGFSEMQLLKGMAENLKNKSDDELTEEIKKLKGIMAEDEGKLKQQLQAIKPFRTMLSDEQKAKFDIIMKALEE